MTNYAISRRALAAAGTLCVVGWLLQQPGGAPQSEAAYLSGLKARTVARGAGYGALRDAASPAAAGRIRVLSFNVNSLRKRASEPHFAAWLRAAAPDVLCLQEVKIGRAGELRSALLEGGCGGGAWRLSSTSAFAARAASENVTLIEQIDAELKGQAVEILGTVTSTREFAVKGEMCVSAVLEDLSASIEIVAFWIYGEIPVRGTAVRRMAPWTS